MAFKWCCQARAKKYVVSLFTYTLYRADLARFEKENNLYASLAQLIREKVSSVSL